MKKQIRMITYLQRFGFYLSLDIADHKVLEYPSMKCRSLRSGFSISGYITMFHMVCRPIFERTIASFLLRNRISYRGHAYPLT